MGTDKIEILESSRQALPERYSSASIVKSFEMELFGTTREYQIVCADSEVTLRNLVHPTRQLCDIICQHAVENQMRIGRPVRCSAGCAACCKYAVAVSLAEAFVINEQIDSLPRQQRTLILRSMTMMARKILDNPPPIEPVISKDDFNRAQSLKQLVKISDWYAGINLTCPWLGNKMCNFYDERPLVCREFLVVSNPAYCHVSSQHKKEVVALPIRMAEVLTEICAILLQDRPQTMFLPLVPAWYEDIVSLGHKQFDAEEVISILLDTLSRHQERSEVQAAVSC